MCVCVCVCVGARACVLHSFSHSTNADETHSSRPRDTPGHSTEAPSTGECQSGELGEGKEERRSLTPSIL